MLLGKIAHEQLFYLQTAGIPPSEANQERVSSGAARESGGFSVQKKPLFRIFQSGSGATRNDFVALLGKKLQTRRVGSNKFRRGKPVSHGKMLTKTVGGYPGAKQSCHRIFFARLAERCGGYGRGTRRF